MPPTRNPLVPAALIGATVLVLAGGLGWAAGWIGPHRISGGEVANALEANGGVFPAIAALMPRDCVSAARSGERRWGRADDRV
jgi:hypothetical protein